MQYMICFVVVLFSFFFFFFLDCDMDGVSPPMYVVCNVSFFLSGNSETMQRMVTSISITEVML